MVADGERTEGGEGAGQTRKRSPLRATTKTILALLSAVVLVLTGYAYNILDQFEDNVGTTNALDLNDELAPQVAPPPKDDGATDILLVGADTRTDMQGNPLPLAVLKQLRTELKLGVNTDTLIVLRIPKNGATPTAVSIPRDTWVHIPGKGEGKINSVFWSAKVVEMQRLRDAGMQDSARLERDSDQAGRRALVQALQEFTRVRIDHYAEIGLLGFYLLTEALGGVQVCLNHATVDKDSGAQFEAGPQVVSGGEALSFVRQRKNLPRGDLDRILRQQAFLASALNQVFSAGTLANPGRLDKLTGILRRSLVMDPDLDLLSFAEQAKGMASGDIKFVTIPVTSLNGRSADGQSIVTVNLGKVRSFISRLAHGQPAPQSPAAGGGGSGGGGGGGAPLRAPQITADDVPCVN